MTPTRDSQPRFKVGICGFGGAGIAEYHHFQSLGCEVVSIFDPNPPARERAKRISAAPIITSDFDSFLKSEIDMVAICSPDRTHAEYFVRSLRAGKHVICEKPLSDSLDGCRRILSASRERPECIAAVQHQMRFLPVHVAMRDIIDRGELGAIAYLEGYYIHNLTERASRYDAWRFEDNATPLVYSGCHFVDLLRWLLTDEVVEVVGMANNIAFPHYPESDTNVILLRFRSGVIGKVVTAFGFGRPQDHSVRIYGNEKCIENNLLFSKDGSFTIFAHPRWEQPHGLFFRGRLLRARIITRVIEQLIQTRHLRNLPAEHSVASYPLRLYEHGLAVRESLLDFVDAIANRRPPLCGVLDSAKTVATCLAGVEAYRTGRPVAVEKYWLPEFGTLKPSQAAAG